MDALISALASRQYGVVARWQLLELGISEGAIEWRLARRRLHRIHAGVYAVGHTRVCREGRSLAAVLACGDGAVLSCRSAAALWGIRNYEGRIEVIAPNAHRPGRPFAASRSSLEPDEITSHRGIPVTTPERTLIDLGVELQRHQLEKAVREAEFLRLVDFGTLAALLERHPRKRGTRHLRAVVARVAESMAHTRKEQLAGYAVLRYTWFDFDAKAAREIGRMLRRRAA